MKQIREYQLEDQPIGVGGMGQVLKGVDGNGVPVAVKEILPEFVMDMEFRYRLDREIQILKKLNSNNIVKIYDYFEQDGKLYIVMELVDGLNVEKYVEANGPVPTEIAMGFMVKILETMQYIHENGIIHRDIKPNNIMIRRDGDICILDFGIAKDTSSNGGGRTLFGTVLGTSGYMSPEQADGMAVDHRTDIYALGCMFFYMLTAHHAFPTLKNDYEMQRSIAHDPLPRLSRHVNGVPQSIQNILDKATDKNMLRRYQSAREMAEDIKSLSGGGTQINTGNRPTNVTMSIGREGCDITVFPLKGNVSRHHADIQYKVFTGGEYIVYNDCSSNGTLINGKRYTRGMTCNIPVNSNPQILLAGDPECQVDWNALRGSMLRRVKEKEDNFKNEPSVWRPSGQQQQFHPQHGPQNFQPGPAPKYPPYQQNHNSQSNEGNWRPAPSYDFMEAVSVCFNKYATFRGRASRSEFWWFYLFNLLVTIGLNIVTLLTAGFGSIVLILYSLGTLIPTLAVSVRRLHDIDKSGWTLLGIYAGMILLPGIITLIGIFTAAGSNSLSGGAGSILIFTILSILTCLGFGIWLLILMIKPGTDGPNRYDD